MAGFDLWVSGVRSLRDLLPNPLYDGFSVHHLFSRDIGLVAYDLRLNKASRDQVATTQVRCDDMVPWP